jgi:glucose-1-phosphatase
VNDVTPVRPPANAGAPLKLVLFDLGGVLWDFRGPAVLQEMTGAASVDEVWLRWLRSPWVRRFDGGLCTPEEFAEGVVQEWQLDYAPEAFLEAFNTWLAGPFEGAAELVRLTRERVAVGCLSNMSELHWRRHVSQWEAFPLFDPAFISYQLKLVKPDDAIFEHVIATIAEPAANVLFIDDSPVNVERARAHGLQAAQAYGVAAAEQVLRDHGLLD